MNQNDVQLSKKLSWLLRHGAVQENLNISSDGFIKVDDILNSRAFKYKYSISDIRRVVEANNKQRFMLITNAHNELLIKANQGHSLQCVNQLDLQPITAQDIVPIHGTYLRHWKSIKERGLSRMNRNHIHFASGRNATSGIRDDCQLIIYINFKEAVKDGIQFHQSANGVILSKGDEDGFILPKYFLKVCLTKTGEELNY